VGSLFKSLRASKPRRVRFCKTDGCKCRALFGKDICASCLGLTAPKQGYERQ
jgi:hypothetical protein